MRSWLAMQDLRATIAQLCNTHGLRLNTDLGQHFLADEAVLEQILSAAKIEGSDTIVEIGSGLGILTRELAKRAKRVIAIELDARWIPIAKTYAKQEAKGEVEFINENALHVPFPREPYKIVANIPYHITSPLLRHAFLESPRAPSSLTLLIQREVAENICNPTDAGILTIIVGLFGKASMVTRVHPGSFVPPPNVDSAVIQIDCYDRPLGSNEEIEKVLWLLKLSFAQKRKMLSNTIGKLPDGPEKLIQAKIEATRRPQTLSVQEWLTLARLFL
jgi:16S rRNA (adenine1518-N6/adenine1519-N6)-dimethyltransferase